MRGVVRFVFILALGLLWGGSPARAEEIRGAADVQRLCALSAPVVDPLSSWRENLARCRDSDRTSDFDERTAALEGSGDGSACISVDLVTLLLDARDRARRRAWALVQSHRAEVVARDFVVGPWHEDTGTVVVPLHGPVRLGGTDWTVRFVGDEVATFELNAQDAEHAVALHEMGTLVLRVTFALDDRGAEPVPFCDAMPDGTAGLRGRLLLGELVEPLTGRVLASARQPLHAEMLVRGGQVWRAGLPLLRPLALVASMDFEGGEPCSAEDGQNLQLLLETTTLDCYVRGLERNGRLQGALVLGFQMDGAGGIEAPESRMDYVNDPEFLTCVQGAIDAIEIPRPSDGLPMSVRVGMIFKLD